MFQTHRARNTLEENWPRVCSYFILSPSLDLSQGHLVIYVSSVHMCDCAQRVRSEDNSKESVLSRGGVLISLTPICLPGFHLERCSKPEQDHPLQTGILTDAGQHKCPSEKQAGWKQETELTGRGACKGHSGFLDQQCRCLQYSGVWVHLRWLTTSERLSPGAAQSGRPNQLGTKAGQRKVNMVLLFLFFVLFV